VEDEIGLTLPPDYKDFARVYGSGYFMQFLGVCIPRTANPNTRLEAFLPSASGVFVDDEEMAHRVWPRPGGLAPFGATDNGDYLFWLTRGRPDEWPIVVWDRGLWQLEAFECDLTNFLAGLATGDLLPKEFPPDLVCCDHLFQPRKAMAG
jgi:hypothetical protein